MKRIVFFSVALLIMVLVGPSHSSPAKSRLPYWLNMTDDQWENGWNVSDESLLEQFNITQEELDHTIVNGCEYRFYRFHYMRVCKQEPHPITKMDYGEVHGCCAYHETREECRNKGFRFVCPVNTLYPNDICLSKDGFRVKNEYQLRQDMCGGVRMATIRASCGTGLHLDVPPGKVLDTGLVPTSYSTWKLPEGATYTWRDYVCDYDHRYKYIPSPSSSPSSPSS